MNAFALCTIQSLKSNIVDLKLHSMPSVSFSTVNTLKQHFTQLKTP